MSSAIIVTFHQSNNYGACLQAYATLRLLQNEGVKSRFLNYRNLYEQAKDSRRFVDCLKRHDYKRALKLFGQMAIGSNYMTAKAFKRFHQMLPVTDEKSNEELNDLVADIFISGSDQLWNPNITNGVDPRYYLQFGKPLKRISFATSMGDYTLSNEKERSLINEYLSCFDEISVRENKAARQIEEVTGRHPFVCLDPTLLLNPTEWRNLAKKPKMVQRSEKYVLYFTLDTFNKCKANRCIEYSRRCNLPCYRVTNNLLQYKSFKKHIRGIDPFELIWLIDNASMVCTDSFHGTAFSLNLNTPLIVFPSKSKNDCRMLDLLHSVGLESQFDDLEGELCNYQVDGRAAEAVLNARRKKSLEWLRKALIL